jgi:hypothetical protein
MKKEAADPYADPAGPTPEDIENWKHIMKLMANPYYQVTEEMLLTPTDPNAEVQNNEPKPGEVGYAPQGRIGQ